MSEGRSQETSATGKARSLEAGAGTVSRPMTGTNAGSTPAPTLPSVEVLCRIKTAAGGHRLADTIYNERWIARVRARSTVDSVKGCWLWQGFIHGNGYGNTSYRGENGRLHRLSFEVFKGQIPAGHDVCHSCDVRNCWNPDHLFSGTRQDNHDDMWAKGRAWQQKETCKHGHPWRDHAYIVIGTNKSTGKSGEWRKCRECDRLKARKPSYQAWRREYQRKRRAARRELRA